LAPIPYFHTARQTTTVVSLNRFSTVASLVANPSVSLASENVRFLEQVKCPVS
jgi:hypothetical protein